MSRAVSLVPKVVKYMKLVLELVRLCKYGAFFRIWAYALPMWRDNPTCQWQRTGKVLGGLRLRLFLQEAPHI